MPSSMPRGCAARRDSYPRRRRTKGGQGIWIAVVGCCESGASRTPFPHTIPAHHSRQSTILTSNLTSNGEDDRRRAVSQLPENSALMQNAKIAKYWERRKASDLHPEGHSFKSCAAHPS